MANRFDIANQFKSLVQLPGQMVKTANSQYQNYALNKTYQAQMNKKNKMYGRGKNPYPTYKKGGTVKKTGLALVHKGERVLTKKQQTDMRYNKITSRIKKKMSPR